MPYKIKNNCVYKKDTGKKVGCSKDVKKYLAALHANVDESENMVENKNITDSTIIDFIIELEKSKIVAIDSHNNQSFINTISAIVSMDEKEFISYIIKNPNDKVKMVRSEFNDWIKSYRLDESETLNEMKGGLADGKTLNDIAKKHGVSVSKLQHQLDMGKKVEIEHTDSTTIAKEIAMDHLIEIPDYYTRLAAMEKKADKKDINESTKDLIKRLIRENIGLYLVDETPEHNTYDLLVNRTPVGKITVGQASKNFGKDTLEILNIRLSKECNHLDVTRKAIESLFKKYPDINRIIIQPKPESRDFWYKLDGQRIDSKYMIILRGH